MVEKSNHDDTEGDPEGGSTTHEVEGEVEGGGGSLLPQRAPTGPGRPKGRREPDDDDE